MIEIVRGDYMPELVWIDEKSAGKSAKKSANHINRVETWYSRVWSVNYRQMSGLWFRVGFIRRDKHPGRPATWTGVQEATSYELSSDGDSCNFYKYTPEQFSDAVMCDAMWRRWKAVYGAAVPRVPVLSVTERVRRFKVIP